MSAGTADPESVRTSITSMNALLDPLKHLYLNLADADGKTTSQLFTFEYVYNTFKPLA